ncbi:ATP-binding cassette domain-containing protein [Candidatus Poribacteria bacterium]|nr:ATP-binding cassette domain-containing protein [Candidatus Poribacteria bacterium]
MVLDFPAPGNTAGNDDSRKFSSPRGGEYPTRRAASPDGSARFPGRPAEERRSGSGQTGGTRQGGSKHSVETKVEIKKLTRHFGPIVAVDDISFQVRRGEVLGFLGPNGAGKSTTMKMVTCFLSPTSGTATVCGHDILESPTEVRRRIGYLPEGAPAYPDMTPIAFLHFIADIRGLRGPRKRQSIENVIEQVGLQGVLRQPIDTLSKGFKRRVGLAQAILHDPEVLILDEPTDGLDPNQKHDVRTLIQKMAKEKVIILSTHILEEVDAVCTRAIIIASGRVIFDGTPFDLQARSRYHNAVTITLRDSHAEDAEGSLRSLENVQSVERAKCTLEGFSTLLVFSRNGDSILGPVSSLLNGKSWDVEELHSEAGRLDEVFRTLTANGKEVRR